MAKATVTYKCARCGETFEISRKFGSRKEADQWEAWAEDTNPYNECPECFRLRKQQEREAADIAAAEKSRGAGFPDLTGSEKQIAWATKIRQDFFDDHYPFDKPTTTEMLAGYMPCDFAPVTPEWFAEWLKKHTDSRYWIDHRENFRGIREKIHEEWWEYNGQNHLI